MRVLMTFVSLEPPATEDKRVLTGPAWEAGHVADVFDLMQLPSGGRAPLEVFTAGLVHARRALERSTRGRQPKIEKTLESLATWATVARIKGATAITWIEDF